MRCQSAGGRTVDAPQPGEWESASEPLVGEGGIREAITEHNRASIKRGLNQVNHMLVTGCQDEKRFGLGRNLFVGRREQRFSDRFGDLGPTWLTGRGHRIPGFAKRGIEVV